MSFIKYIADENHYKEVLSLVGKAKQTVWIGTADIKDLYVDDKPFLALLAGLLKKGVEVRLIHAKEPGTAWREDHEKKFPSIKVYYREEECGCEVYHTNDTTGQYFSERYFLDSYDDPMYYETIEEAAESISKRIDRKIEPTFDAITDALDDYVEEHEDDDEEVFFSFHEFSAGED